LRVDSNTYTNRRVWYGFPVDESVLQLRLQLAESTDKLDLADCGLTEVPPEVFRLHDLQRPGVAPGGPKDKVPRRISYS